jgi:hypothetical protein
MTDFSPEHLGSGGVGAVLTGALMWGWRFLRQDRADSRAAGVQEQRLTALEAAHRELRQDVRDFRAEVKHDLRDIREALERRTFQGGTDGR